MRRYKQQALDIPLSEMCHQQIQILDAAIDLARTKPYTAISRYDLCDRVGYSAALINYYAGTMRYVRIHMMRRAIQTQALHVLAQGIANYDPEALKAPPSLRRKVGKYIASQ